MSTKIIRPISLKADEFHPFEKTLADNKLTRVPGTGVWVLPAIDTAGRIKTGIDEKSAKIRNIADDSVRAVEEEAKMKLRKSLQERTGYNLEADTNNGTPISPFYAEVIENGGYELKDGDNVFNMSSPLDVLNFKWLCETGIVASSYEAYTSGKYLPGQVLYYVYEEDAEEKYKYARIQKQDNAVNKLGQLSEAKRLKVAKLLGLGVSDTAIPEVVYNTVREYLSLPSSSTTKDPIDNFNKYALLSDEVIDIEYLVYCLIDKNVVRSHGGVIKLGETVLAKNIETFKLDLLDPKNNELLESLTDKLKSSFSAIIL